MNMAELLGITCEKEKPSMKGIQLIDYSQLVLATIMAVYKEGEVLTEKGLRVLILNTVKANVSKNKAKYPTTIICVDDASQGYWRRDLAYYYKKNRKAKRDASKWDWPMIYKAMETVREEIRENFPYIVINKTKTEADDIIGVMVKYIHETSPITEILICSSDGDFVQLQQYRNVKQWSPIQKKWVIPKHGSPMSDLRFKIIKGDQKDGIGSIREVSDFMFIKEEGQRSKPISTEKMLNPLLRSSNPLSLLTEEEQIRYIENEKLLDLGMIPDYISRPIIEEFEKATINPRSKIYSYLAKYGVIELLDSVSDF